MRDNMTEQEMLEAEKYWCENCCNWDKEEVQMDACFTCKLTGTRIFAQESGKECKCFNVPAENVIVPPCRVGDKVWCVVNELGKVVEGRVRGITIFDNNILIYCGLNGYFEQIYKSTEFNKFVYPTREEAERALKGGAE